jgi:hypothetical protein
MFGVVSALDPVHVQIARFQIDLLPAQGHEFRRVQSMAKHHHNNGRIAHSMASGFASGLHHGLHFVRA